MSFISLKFSLFCNFFLNIKNRNGLPNHYFLYLVFWKLFLKVGTKHGKHKNYYLKISFKINFFEIKKKKSYQWGPNHHYMEYKEK